MTQYHYNRDINISFKIEDVEKISASNVKACLTMNIALENGCLQARKIVEILRNEKNKCTIFCLLPVAIRKIFVTLNSLHLFLRVLRTTFTYRPGHSLCHVLSV